MIKFIFAVLLMFSISGCRDAEREKEFSIINKENLKGDGQCIGTLKDGREVTRFRVANVYTAEFFHIGYYSNDWVNCNDNTVWARLPDSTKIILQNGK